MMWKNFNVISENNNRNNLKNISVFKHRTGYCETGIDQNMDCLMHVLSHLTINEKVNCRLVCKSWRTAVDKLFSGQRSLKIVFNNTKDFYCYSELNPNDRIAFISPLMTYKMRKQLKFQLFHQMMSKFPSVQTLVVQHLPLTDVMILVVTNTCRQLNSLTLISCKAKQHYYNNNYINNSSKDSVCHQITSYGWKLFVNTYGQSLKHLAIRNCSLNDSDYETVLLGFPYLTYLDLSDNEQLNGTGLQLLGSECVSLCVGSLSTDKVWIQPILQSLSQSNTRLKRLELRGGINQQLTAISALQSVEELSVMFFCPQDQMFDTLSPIAQLVNLRKLTLQQERCYDEHSSIDGHSLAAIADGCPSLTELVINGEYGWKLRLTDSDIKILVNKCQRLQHICLTGNSSAITDAGALYLLSLAKLRSVSLTSFDKITDEGVIPLITKPSIRYIAIKESTTITNRILSTAIEVAVSQPTRQLTLFLSETKVSKPKRTTKALDNLKIIIEENLRPRRQSYEPSAMKMMAVVGMSAIILAMIIITMLVVIIMPIGMLLMMFYENCVEYALNNSDIYLNKDNPLEILSFYGSQAIRHLTET